MCVHICLNIRHPLKEIFISVHAANTWHITQYVQTEHSPGIHTRRVHTANTMYIKHTLQYSPSKDREDRFVEYSSALSSGCR